MKEKEIENLICTWLNLQPGVFAFKVNTGGVYDVAKGLFRKNKNRHIRLGTADVICSISVAGVPVFAAFEIKTQTGRQSEHQKEFELSCKRVGAFYFVLRSIDDAKIANAAKNTLKSFSSLDILFLCSIMAGGVGLEPTTDTLTVYYSTS